MKKIFFLVLCVVLFSGCQTINQTHYQEGQATPVGYSGNNPYWGNNYRINTSNYLGNRNFNRPTPEVFY